MGCGCAIDSPGCGAALGDDDDAALAVASAFGAVGAFDAATPVGGRRDLDGVASGGNDDITLSPASAVASVVDVFDCT